MRRSACLPGTHRVAFELTRGAIPDGLLVCHRCDNPPCCNPAHLFLGTKAHNNSDRHQKGRTVPSGARGERAGKAKLTDAEVQEMRRLRAMNVPQDELAERFNVNQSMVSRVVNRKNWRHVP